MNRISVLKIHYDCIKNVNIHKYNEETSGVKLLRLKKKIMFVNSKPCHNFNKFTILK